MLRIIYFYILYLFIQATVFGSVDQQKIESLRLNYYKAVEEEKYIDTFNAFIDTNFSQEEISGNSVLDAYKAAIVAVKAKHAFWPFTKMTYLNESMELFEKVIADSPDNLEIRFLRFTILHYIPGILGFSDERDEDLVKIVELLSERDFADIPDDLVEGIYNFMIESDRLNEQQQTRLNTSRMHTNIN